MLPSRARARLDILRHEAGHLVVAKLLGFETGFIQFGIYDAGAEITLAAHFTELPAIVAYIKRRVTVLYAGVLAEALNGNRVDTEQARQDLTGAAGANDFAKIRELLTVLAGIEGADIPVNSDEYREPYFQRALTIVEKHAEVIHGLAAALIADAIAADGVIEKGKIESMQVVESIKVGSEL